MLEVNLKVVFSKIGSKLAVELEQVMLFSTNCEASSSSWIQTSLLGNEHLPLSSSTEWLFNQGLSLSSAAPTTASLTPRTYSRTW